MSGDIKKEISGLTFKMSFELLLPNGQVYKHQNVILKAPTNIDEYKEHERAFNNVKLTLEKVIEDCAVSATRQMIRAEANKLYPRS